MKKQKKIWTITSTRMGWSQCYLGDRCHCDEIYIIIRARTLASRISPLHTHGTWHANTLSLMYLLASHAFVAQSFCCSRSLYAPKIHITGVSEGLPGYSLSLSHPGSGQFLKSN